MEQAVVFTLLPQDVLKPGGDYQATVFVSPRLTPDGPGATAGDFTAFEDWPAVVAASIAVQKLPEAGRPPLVHTVCPVQSSACGVDGGCRPGAAARRGRFRRTDPVKERSRRAVATPSPPHSRRRGSGP